jgi:hypothetical protein
MCVAGKKDAYNKEKKNTLIPNPNSLTYIEVFDDLGMCHLG